MASVLKILSEMGQDDNKALLIELPAHLVDQVDVGMDGSVDTLSLLKILRQAAVEDMQKQAQPKAPEEDEIARQVALMNLIFNPEIAVNTDRS